MKLLGRTALNWMKSDGTAILSAIFLSKHVIREVFMQLEHRFRDVRHQGLLANEILRIDWVQSRGYIECNFGLHRSILVAFSLATNTLGIIIFDHLIKLLLIQGSFSCSCGCLFRSFLTFLWPEISGLWKSRATSSTRLRSYNILA